jgi:hypothetical protein
MRIKFRMVTMGRMPRESRPVGVCRRLYDELIRYDGAVVPRALKVACESLARLYYIQSQLRLLARRDGRKLGSRRNVEGTILWVWLERAPPAVSVIATKEIIDRGATAPGPPFRL